MLKLNNIRLVTEQRTLLDNFSLVINPGEVVSLMGPSGCGKSTLLTYISGALADEIDATGSIKINHQEISQLPMEQRHVGLLFQDDLLFPHMSIAGNLAFALPWGLNKKTRQEQVDKALAQVGLAGHGNMRPEQLSGGQRARISLMRTLLAEPKALLLDEPFSKLDSHLRIQIRDFVFRTIKERNIPALLVTHDQQDCGQRTIQFSAPEATSTL